MAIRPLGKELQAKAIAELNEKPDRIEDDIKIIKQWLSQQRHINARMDDQHILQYLRGCKYSLEKVKTKLENLYTMRALIPEFFTKRDPFLPEIQAVLKLGVILPLQKVEAPDAPRVIIIRFAVMDPTIHLMRTVCKLYMMISDILLHEDDQITIGGLIAFQDAGGISMAHVTNIELPVFKKALMFMEGCYPQRPKAMHFFNTPSVFDMLFNMMKLFMKEKMFNRVKVHSKAKIDDMYQFVPKSILPNECGGNAGPIQELIDYWKNKVESYAEWFKEDEQYKSDESKRVGMPKTESDLFGIEGSFRKLNVD